MSYIRIAHNVCVHSSVYILIDEHNKLIQLIYLKGVIVVIFFIKISLLEEFLGWFSLNLFRLIFVVSIISLLQLEKYAIRFLNVLHLVY